MKTVIMGQNIVHKYTVNSNTKEITDENGEKKVVFTAKPVIEIEDKITYEQICEFAGQMRYNSPKIEVLCWTYLMIQGEEHKALRTEFEVTTQTETIYTDKVLSEEDENKYQVEDQLSLRIMDYNEQIIESDEKMLNHCKLYNLKPADTDCEELFKEVYPGYKFEIDDQGKLAPKNAYTVIADRVAACDFAKFKVTNPSPVLASGYVSPQPCEGEKI